MASPPEASGSSPREGPSSRGDRQQTRDLVAAAKTGDQSAWATLDARYREQLAIVVRGRIPLNMRSRFDTEDVLQTAILSAFTRLEQFTDQGAGSFRKWMQTIVQNRLRDKLRHHGASLRNANTELGLADAASMAASADSATDDVERSDLLARVIERLAHMDEASNRLIKLHFFDEVSIAHLALHTHKSERTIRRNLARALVRLGDLVNG